MIFLSLITFVFYLEINIVVLSNKYAIKFFVEREREREREKERERLMFLNLFKYAMLIISTFFLNHIHLCTCILLKLI